MALGAVCFDVPANPPDEKQAGDELAGSRLLWLSQSAPIRLRASVQAPPRHGWRFGKFVNTFADCVGFLVSCHVLVCCLGQCRPICTIPGIQQT
jgi:hypothetical protein